MINAESKQKLLDLLQPHYMRHEVPLTLEQLEIPAVKEFIEQAAVNMLLDHVAEDDGSFLSAIMNRLNKTK